MRRAATLRRGETPLQLAWEADEEGRVFTFTSAVMKRDTTGQTYVFAVDHEELEVSHAWEREIPLAPLQEMRLEKVDKDEDGDVPRLALVFSDELDPRQDAAGLVQVSGGGGAPEGFGQGDPRGRGVRARPPLRAGRPPGDPQPLGHPHRRRPCAGRSGSPTASRELRFARDGVFLPSSRDRRLRFATLNLGRVYLEVKKVFASNLGPFLQSESLRSGRERRNAFRDWNVRRVGVRVALDTLQIPDERNAWLEHELDLGALIAEGERGIFLVELRFAQEDMLYRPAGRRRGDPPPLRPARTPAGPRLLLGPDVRGLRPRPRTGVQGRDRQRHRADIQARPRPAPRVRHPHRRRPAPVRRRGDPAHLPGPGRRPGHGPTAAGWRASRGSRGRSSMSRPSTRGSAA